MNHFPKFSYLIKDKALPYYLPGNRQLFILVHGFTGSPDDLRPLARLLNKLGYSVRVPLLPGHGGVWTDLVKFTYADWWQAIKQELTQAQGQYDHVFLLGYSFGANLALDLAARYPELVTGLISLGAALYLRYDWPIKYLSSILEVFSPYYQKGYIREDKIEDYEKTGCYSQIPYASLREFKYFIDHYTKKTLHKVCVPSLIIHCRDDSIVKPRSSEVIYQTISSTKKQILILDEIDHNPISSRRRDLIFLEIISFIKRYWPN